ncbi:MAG: hypothetical protein QOH41_1618 [Blastocatellia bacterium]|jgi:hypothetical protein|nr:hypothetical protein [Blastocatellia bacterium]
MTNEEIGQRIEFIIEQQAQFTSDIQILREVQAADNALLKEQHRNLSDAVVAVVGMVGRLAEAQERTDRGVSDLAEKVSELTDAQARTDERLNIFINVVEKYRSAATGTTAQPAHRK